MTEENKDEKSKDAVGQSEFKDLLSTFLDDASKSKAELMDKEIRTFLELQGPEVSSLNVTVLRERGSFESHPDGTEYFLWDEIKVLKFNPPSVDESILTFDCDRLYLK